MSEPDLPELLDQEGGTCNICGGLLRYGERHHQCGTAVMAAIAKERERADALQAEVEHEKNNAMCLRQEVQDLREQVETLNLIDASDDALAADRKRADELERRAGVYMDERDKQTERADALQAENTELKAELKTVYQHHADEEARADALEAALQSALPIIEAYARKNPTWTNGIGPTHDPMGSHALAAAARALLEKPHD